MTLGGDIMANFFKQIQEDIKDYQERFPEVENIKKDEWAFNYWILDKFFYEDEEIILDKIIDYKDYGVDAYEWYEDTKELFLIQNKYYSADTKIDTEYVKNTFLVKPLSVLENGTYNHCKELQNIYTHNKDDERFTVHLQMYITNDKKNVEANIVIDKFNAENQHKRTAEIFYLSDIEEKWYGETLRPTKELKVDIQSVNGGTILNINNDAYHLENVIDAKYVFTPVSCIYKMMKKSKEKGYPLFEKNIREYLGNRGINKNIYGTLKSKEDRKNFFYYNNGITMICENIGKENQVHNCGNQHIGVAFTVKNPQIVNGCQTVNSIFTALKEYDEEDLEDQFKDTFVMLKVLEINPKSTEEIYLSKNIVKFNNSQNAIDEKTFIANSDMFQRLKNEFDSKAFLLSTQHSDKNTFTEKYSRKSDQINLGGKSIVRRQKFGLENLKKLGDFEIKLDKLLQVVLAFKDGGHSAYNLKKDVLKPDTTTYNTVVEFIKSSNVTTDVLLDLYLLYLKAEKMKKASVQTGKMPSPIPYYFIDAFAKFECNERESKFIAENLSTKDKIDKLLKFYKKVCSSYAKEFTDKNHIDYNDMIKKEVDYSMLQKERERIIEFLEEE